MKLILIHGSFADAALKKVSQIKKDFNPLSITEISDVGPSFNLASPGLFSEKRLVIFNSPDIKTVEKMISETDPDLTVLIYFSKNLEKSSAILKKVTEIKADVFSFTQNNEVSIFPLLDMLGAKNKNAFKEFEKNYSEFGGQYILVMLAYFLRRIIQKPKSSSSFMLQKLNTQKNNFPVDRIKNLYKSLIEIDFKIKQGLIEERLGVTILIHKILS